MGGSSVRCALGLAMCLFAASIFAQQPLQFLIHDWPKPPYKSVVIDRAPGSPLVFKPPDRSGAVASRTGDLAQKVASKPSVLALLLIGADNTLLFEAYRHKTNARTRFKGASMTKSVVSVALGQAYCDGLISALGDRASNYSDSLKGTAYGDAKISELLAMGSAGSRSVEAGVPTRTFRRELQILQSRTLRSSFVEFGRHHHNPSRQGVFEYKALDTAALSILIADSADSARVSFSEYFSRKIWSKIGAERDAEMLVDGNGDAVAFGGLAATLRDWGRLAIYLRDRRNEQTCLGDYLKQATRAQITFPRKSEFPNFAAYGYQFWIDNKHVSGTSAWLSGQNGQRIGIANGVGLVVVLFSHDNGAVRDLYQLFDAWLGAEKKSRAKNKLSIGGDAQGAMGS